MKLAEIESRLGSGVELSDMLADLWNGPYGRRFESIEQLQASLLSDSPDVELLVHARQWLGLPVIS